MLLQPLSLPVLLLYGPDQAGVELLFGSQGFVQSIMLLLQGYKVGQSLKGDRK